MQRNQYDDHATTPPWTEEPDPHWDIAFGCYGDGYLEWVHTRYFWEPEADRIVADTRRLWEMQHEYDEAREAPRRPRRTERSSARSRRRQPAA